MEEAENQPTEPFLQGISLAEKEIHWRFYISRTIFLVMVISGVWTLAKSLNSLFFVYPYLPVYFREHHFDQNSLNPLINQAILISISSFFESSLGMALLLKKKGTVKGLQIVTAILLFLLSSYFKISGELLDADAVRDTTELVMNL